MERNPFSPPQAELGKLPPSSPWHLSAAVGLLGLLGGWKLVAAVAPLLESGAAGIPLWFFYLAVLPALLTLCAAYTLWRRKFWVVLLLVAAPLVNISVYLVVPGSSRVSLATSFAGQLAERLPQAQLLQLGVFAAAIVYVAILRKWSLVN